MTGTLLDSTTIDLTPRARGTQYASSDLLVCNFGAADGVVFAGNDGSCTVTASNSGFSGSVAVTVSTFAPTARAVLPLPGFANNVDVAGGRAFVAAGSAGLLVIDVEVRTAPRIAATLGLAGNANDVKVRGGLAYVAAGSAGLHIVDVSDPASPVLRGFLDTAGDARDVALAGDLAFVAAGGAGMQIVDVGDPGAPALLGAFDTAGEGKGVEVSADGGLAVVADGAAGLRVLDVADPSSPVLVGSVATTDARDVDVVGTAAWVADFTGGLTSVELSDPAAPRILASVAREFGGIPTDVVVTEAAGPFALAAEVGFVNAVPIVEVSDAANPLPRTPLDFSASDDFNGTGLAADEHFVYLTASKEIVENGSSGETRLYVGQYLGFEDDAGVAPSVRLVSPEPGTAVPVGGSIRLEAEATDDVGVFVVRLLADGDTVAEDDNPPYAVELTAPSTPAVVTFSAVALDFAGNRGEAAPVEVRVVGRATTSVVGSVVDGAATPVAGADVFTRSDGRAVSDAGGLFRLDDVPADEGDVVVFAAAERGDESLRGRSEALAPVAGGLTDAGEIVVEPLGGYPGRRFLLSPAKNRSGDPGTLTTGDFDGDGRLDVAARSSDLGNRIAVLYGDAPAPAVWLATSVTPSRLAAADLDGDGASDLIALNRQSDDLSVFLARDGGFAPERRLAAGDEPIAVAVGDLSRDAVPDLAVLNRLSGDVTVLLGLGGGEYLPAPSLAAGTQPAAIVAADLDADGVADLAAHAVGVDPAELAAADFDGDGGLDLAVVNAGSSDLSILLNRGGGDFEAELRATAGPFLRNLAAVDADRDGRPDLVVRDGFPEQIAVLLGNGDGTFRAGQRLGAGRQADAVAVADVDLDGIDDMVSVNRLTEDVSVYRGRGDGTFAEERRFAAGGGVDSIEVADVDHDGRPDLVVLAGEIRFLLRK